MTNYKMNNKDILLEKVLLINWHYIENELIDLKGSNTIFTGDNASGKSTIMDAIKMILTVNRHSFNSASSERKGTRTLKGYVRGQLDEESSHYLRIGNVISYVACEFSDGPKNFVVGLKLESTDSKSNDIDYRWFLVNDSKLEDISFITDGKPSRNNELFSKDQKIIFITRDKDAEATIFHRFGLMGNLGRKFVKVLAKSFAFTDVNNIRDFIFDFILPEKKVDISKLTKTMYTLNQFNELLNKKRIEADFLRKILENADQVRDLQRKECFYNTSFKIVNKLEIESKIALQINSKRRMENELRTLEGEFELLDDKYKQLIEEKSNSLGDTDFLFKSVRKDIENNQNTKLYLEEENGKYLFDINKMHACASYYEKEAIQNKIDVDSIIMTLLNEDDSKENKSKALSKIQNFLEREKIKNNEINFELSKELDNNQKQIQKFEEDLRLLKLNIHRFPSNAVLLKDCINDYFKEKGIDSEAKILAEIIEISSLDWRNAIEGYLNTQKFNIIVDTQFYDIALEAYNLNLNKIHSTGIINSKELNRINYTINLNNNSLASHIWSSSFSALNYACYLLNDVIMVDNFLDLKKFNVSMTKDCLLYKNYVTRNINPESYRVPYIGKDSIVLQINILEKQIIDLKFKNDMLINKITFHTLIKHSHESFYFPNISERINFPNLLKKCKNEFNDLKAREVEYLTNPIYKNELNRLNEVESILNETHLRKETNRDLKSSLKNELERCENILIEYNNKLNDVTITVEEIKKENLVLYTESLKKVESEIINVEFNTLLMKLDNKTRINSNQLQLSTEQLRESQSEFIYNYQIPDLSKGYDAIPAYSSYYNEIVSSKLLELEQQIHRYEHDAWEEFKTDFTFRMRDNIVEARQDFDLLNGTMKNIPFGEDRFSYKMIPKKEMFYIYEIIMNENISFKEDNIFYGNITDEQKSILEELFEKFRKNNNDDGINIYSDYRNYFDYELVVTKDNGRVMNISKNYGSGSGGEKQTPYYVTIVASFNQLYNRGKTIKIIMLDEAFDKMDDYRIESMMTFINQMNLQVIIATPPSKAEVLSNYCDSIFLVNRHQSRVNIGSYYDVSERNRNE